MSHDHILYEDLCFDVQQSAEKALKAVCISRDIIFQRTHDISYLIDILEENGVNIPDDLAASRYLTQYAVETRYPGFYDPIMSDEFQNALEDAEIVFNWASKMTGFSY